MRVRKGEASRKADPQLQYFLDCLREAMGKEPLYDRRYRPDIERFNIAPYPELTAQGSGPVY